MKHGRKFAVLFDEGDLKILKYLLQARIDKRDVFIMEIHKMLGLTHANGKFHIDKLAPWFLIKEKQNKTTKTNLYITYRGIKLVELLDKMVEEA